MATGGEVTAPQKQSGMPKPVYTNFGMNKCRKFEYECDFDVAGTTFTFGFMYLSINENWMSSLKREFQSFSLAEGRYYIYRTGFTLDGILVYAFGAGFSGEEASDASCYYLRCAVAEKNRGFALPIHLIGYPNIRGHCYLLSAVIPLLHSLPFIECLFEASFEYKRKCNLGEKKEKLKERTFPESPFFWTNTMFKIYKEYRIGAKKEKIDFNNIDYFIKHKLKINSYQKREDIPDAIKKPDDDLRLDRSLIHGLCSVLATYCDPDYLSPGGDERVTYQYIMRKLASEITGFADKFFLRVETTFTCRSCTGGPYSGTFDLPIIFVNPGTDFGFLLSNAGLLAGEQNLYCTHRTEEFHCADRSYRNITAEFRNTPLVLCFGIKYINTKNPERVPNNLKLKVGDSIVEYTRLCSSVCFTTYKNPTLGKDYMNFYHVKVEGDEVTSAHTYLQFKTTAGFVEVNDGYLWSIDPRIDRVPTPGSLHYYVQKKYESFLPIVNPSNIQSNPMY